MVFVREKKKTAPLKGCEKRVILVKNPKSAVFEEAYFILRRDGEEVSEEDIVSETERLLAEGEKSEKGRLTFGIDELLFFAAGLFLALLVSAALFLITSLC